MLRRKAQSTVAQSQSASPPPSPDPNVQLAPPAQTREDRVLVDSYPVYEPYVRIGISQEQDGSRTYIVIEPRLSKRDKLQLKQIKDVLKHGLEIDPNTFKSEDAEKYLTKETMKLVKRFGLDIPEYTLDKLFYFVRRDFLHYGIIDPLMRDPNIEDISCNGPGQPIYVFHRDYESIPTNVMFKDQENLEKFILRLAYMSGRHISVATPIVDASLPDGSRIQMTFGSEITKKGSTFTIRKFKEDPYSIVDLVRFGTVGDEMAATLWYLIENKGSILMAGGTASGKSIMGNEPVLVYQKGVSCLIPISEFYEQAAKSGRYRREEGYEVIECDDTETAAFDESLKVQRSRVKAVIRHPSPSHVLRIKTRTGRSVTVTGDHSIFTLIDGIIQPFPAALLEPGMFLAAPRVLGGSERSPAALDVVEAFAENDYGLYAEDASSYVRKGVEVIGKEAVREILGLKPRSFTEMLTHRSMAVRVSKLCTLAHRTGQKLDPSRLRVRTKNYRSGSIPALIPASRELMRLIGYWISEGMYDNGLKIDNLDNSVREEVKELTKTCFGIHAVFHKTDRTRISIGSRPLELFFRHVLRLEGGSGNKKIPEFVMGQTDGLLAECLRAYYTGDGTANDTIETMTKSSVLAHQLLYALLRFGIISQMAPKSVNGTPYYRVTIYGRKGIERFAQYIGFLNHNRQKVDDYLAKMADVPVHTNYDTIPGIASLLKQSLQFKRGADRKALWADWHTYGNSPKRMSQQTLVSFAQEVGASGEILQKLETLAYSELFWDEVVELEEVPCKDQYVYDLEVPGRQNFVGGQGGLFLHNTTSINCLALFIRPDAKVVTIEDTPEINLAHSNWIESVSRQGVSGQGEVTLYDLLRAALRQRPDFIIVGEVRGEEANTMFQALSTGHSGMSSIHADSIPAVFHRLTQPPMNIPRTLIPAVNMVIQQSRVTYNDKPVRRVLSVTEVVGLDTRTNELITNEVYRYNQSDDTFVYSGRSYIMERLAKSKGMTMDELRQEIAIRKQVIQWMVRAGKRRYRDVADVIDRYYTDRAGLLAELGASPT